MHEAAAKQERELLSSERAEILQPLTMPLDRAIDEDDGASPGRGPAPSPLLESIEAASAQARAGREPESLSEDLILAGCARAYAACAAAATRASPARRVGPDD